MSSVPDSFEPRKIAPVSSPTAEAAANGDAPKVDAGPQNHSKDGLAIAAGTPATPQGSLTALSAVRSARAEAKDPTGGYAQRFERRPEWMWNRLLMMVDATPVRERLLGDIKVVQISKIFSGKDEVALGFGVPNVYTFFPKSEGEGYDKFAAKSRRRAPASIDDARDLIQSAPLARFMNLPTEARIALRKAFEAEVGNLHASCARANATALHNAGFRVPGWDMRTVYRPVTFMRAIADRGLEWNGKKVEIDWVRTPSVDIETHRHNVAVAELTTPYRHFRRAIDPKLEAIGWFRFVAALTALVAPKKTIEGPAPRISKVVAPALALKGNEQTDFVLRVSQPTWLGGHLRRLWGPHTLFELNQNRVDINEFLPEDLKPFPGKLSAFSRVKSWFFNPATLWLMHRVASPKYAVVDAAGERDIHRMLRTDADGQPNVYNIVIKRQSEIMEDGSAIVVLRTAVRYKAVDWVLTKHLFASNYAKVAYAAELWKGADGRIYVNMNSGTYKPTKKEQAGVIAYLSKVFPNAEFVAVEK